ncbi:MAG: PHP domain-containing protein [Patescibacteria group bacterium]|nr:PHP domain-containing protein [Patescibacteria group bacterium]MDD5554075.1 PHP domain-containing protein [Patescibacteria group bacterium]
MLIDLQLHSNYSDGYLTPTETAKFIAGQGVKVAALTDHNTVGGFGEFRRACRQYRVKPIIGLELYAKLGGTRLNLLWFNFDEKDAGLHDLLRDSQIRRKIKVRKILKKLARRGFEIDINRIIDKYTHYVPLNHVVDDVWAIPANRAKIKKELKIKNPREGEIIGEYFRNKSTSILRESYTDIKKIISLRKKIGGILIFNHPGKHDQLKRKLLEKLKRLGVDGIEVLSPHHSIGAVMYAQAMAREFDFIATGGSDFHRHERDKLPVQNSWNYFKVDSKYLRGVKKIIG